MERLWAQGWRRFEVPIAPTVDASVERLAAAREVAPDGWIGFDANMAFRTVDEVLKFERRVRPLRLGWIEDVVPQGTPAWSRRCVSPSALIAMGDDQGGSYHPEALLAAGAVDVLRVDATTNGGLTRLRPILERARAAGVQVIAAHVPACALTAASRARLQGRADRVGHPGTGVHAMDDPLEQPVVSEGRMESLEDAPGFGRLLEPDGSSNRTLWIPIVYSTTYATTEEGGGMEFLVHITVEWPPDGDADLKQRLIQEEGKRARELADAGVIHRLWRIPGRWANVGLWEAADATALHDALASLPLFPWVRAVVEPLARHPSDPACQPAD